MPHAHVFSEFAVHGRPGSFLRGLELLPLHLTIEFQIVGRVFAEFLSLGGSEN
jgi:hypothetical protein